MAEEKPKKEKNIRVKINGDTVEIGEGAVETTKGKEFKYIVKDLKKVTQRKIFKEKEK